MEYTIMEENNTTLQKGHKRHITHATSTSKPIAPTTSLPPLGRLPSISTDQVSTALLNLRSIYFPPPPPPLPKNITIPSRNLPKHLSHGSSSVPDSGYASADDEDEDDTTRGHSKEGAAPSVLEVWVQPEQNGDVEAELELLRADSFERAFAIKWITGFIARCDVWVDLAGSGEYGIDSGELVDGKGGDCESTVRERLVEDAAAILSLFCGDGEEFAVTRTFEFPLECDDDEIAAEGNVINVELNDAPMLSRDHTSVGLQSWASSILLAQRIVASPSSFSLIRTTPPRPLRILELGAGTGLLSITAAKILSEAQPSPLIVATDYHPDVLENLQKNIHTNFPPAPHPLATSHYPINIGCLDWEHPQYDAPLDERFDVILGADVIYHPDHARWIKNCVEKLLKRPTPCRSDGCTEGPSQGGVFWMMIAVRRAGRHEGLHATVDELFGPVFKRSCALVILHKEEVMKQDGLGRSDEGGYVLFKIGWSS